MRCNKTLLACLAIISGASNVEAKSVFAHVVAGNSGSYSRNDWNNNIKLAKSAGIDGFIMNIAPNTYQLAAQLDNVYDVANKLQDFSIFLSFDYLGGNAPWNASMVIELLNTYSGHPAQFHYNGLPVVTTFEGTNNAADWPNIKSATGGLFFLPDYTSLGAPGAASQPAVDGLASWVAWPDGPNYMTNGSDIWYTNTLSGKPYMMPVSPWFYANVNNENFLYRGDQLWFDRWQQVIELQPEIVQIISWNDFGESHYIGPLPPGDANAIPGNPPENYTAKHPHKGWLSDLPYFISWYKNGRPPATFTEHITISYKVNPSTSGSDGGIVCKATSSSTTYPAAECSLDEMSITVLASATSNVTAYFGGFVAEMFVAQPGMNSFAVPFKGRTGKPMVSMTRGLNLIARITGKAMKESADINWNAWVGSTLEL